MAKTANSNILASIDYSKTIFSPRWFMENMLYIVDKNGKLGPFRLNREQNILMEHIEFCLANDIPVRIMLLKARQIGATTFFTALGFWFACMNRNKSYGIVAHRLDSAYSIFNKCKIFYNNLPKEMRPATTQFSSEGITFDKKNGMGINSKIQFATVNEGVFRGQTLSYLHLSECAFWEGNVQAIENSLAPTIAYLPGTIIVRESTANGYNFFKDDWDRAKRGESGYATYFFGWQDHEEYKLHPPIDFVPDETELKIQKEFNLTIEQIYWRHHTIMADYSGDETWFSQEYPMTPEEAFVASGTSVFNPKTIVEGYKNVKDPTIVTLKDYPTFEKLMIWEKPQIEKVDVHDQNCVWDEEQQKHVMKDNELVLETITYEIPYTVGIDTSGGGDDYNEIVVVNNITKKMAARFRILNLDEEYLAIIAIEIAKMYNNAMIAPEVNFSHEICRFITARGYRNIYVTENINREDKVSGTGISYGWATTRGNKGGLISNLRALANEDPSRFPDREFWYQAEYYIVEDPKKWIINAASGHHDDVIMAAAIAEYVSMSRQSRQAKRRINPLKEDLKGDYLTQFVVKHTHPKKTPIRKGIYTNHA